MVVLLAVQAMPCGATAQTDKRGIKLVTIRGDKGENITLYEQSHALVIGVSEYDNGWRPLPGVKRDVESLSAILKERGFDVESLPEPVTRASFDRAIRKFIKQWGQAEKNRLLIYFAGHGHTVKTSYGGELGYLVPADAPSPSVDEAEFKEKAISMSEIEVYARQINSRHVLFVFDSCFSGSLFNENSRAVPGAIVSKTASPVRQFLTAGSAEQTVPDESIFRQYFVRGLKGEADTNPKDGYITGNELGEYIFNKVTNDSRVTQTPRFGTIRDPRLNLGDFVFPLHNNGISEIRTGIDIYTRNRDVKVFSVILGSGPGEASHSLFRKQSGYFVQQGIFINALVQALMGKAADERGEVRLQGLFDYILTKENHSKVQHPFYAVEGFKSENLIISVDSPIVPDVGSKRFALIIGVEEYQDRSIEPIRGATNDAKMLADTLMTHAGIPAEHIIVLATDQPEEQQPTFSNIQRALKSVSSIVPEDGLLLLVFVGHGVEYDHKGYFLPSDIRISDEKSIIEGAIRTEWIRELTKEKISQVLIFMDASRASNTLHKR
jgi:uncharacterized caspase-like protein